MAARFQKFYLEVCYVYKPKIFEIFEFAGANKYLHLVGRYSFYPYLIVFMGTFLVIETKSFHVYEFKIL